MKTKIVVLVGIALCALLLISPALASSVDTLEIYGNANEDDTIDMRDLTYEKLIFFGKKPETELADAKYDGKINPLDFIQIKLIIVGKEREITMIDSRKNIKTFKLPITRIIALDDNDGEPLRLLEAEDLVVGVGTSLVTHPIILPEMSKLPTIGSGFGAGIDYEKVISLEPDLFMGVASWPLKGLEEKLEPAGVQVLLLNFHEMAETREAVRKVGYLIGKLDKAEEFVEFHDDIINNIRDRAEGLSEDEKPRVFITSWRSGGSITDTASKGSKWGCMCNYAGGINIAADLPVRLPKVDPEWVLAQNPDIIIARLWYGSGDGIEDTTKIKEARDEIMNLSGWDNIKAVKNGNVYIESTDISQSGLRGFVCTAYWAKWFHPNLFKDLDPEALHQEYIDRFLRVDYDVKKGTYVYPPLED